MFKYGFIKVCIEVMIHGFNEFESSKSTRNHPERLFENRKVFFSMFAVVSCHMRLGSVQLPLGISHQVRQALFDRYMIG